MSLGDPAATPENGGVPGAPLGIAGSSPTVASDETKSQVQDVLASEVRGLALDRSPSSSTDPFQIGISTILNRLKQSIASAKVRLSDCYGFSLHGGEPVF